MRLKSFSIILGFFLFLILLPIVLGADESCIVTTINGCSTSPWNNIVMRLSFDENAHAGEWNYQTSTYNYVLCCNFPGTRDDCNKGEIIRLSSSTGNAHVGVATQTSYTNSICYTNLTCLVASSCPSTGEHWEALSISSPDTNAHIAKAGYYPYKVCCEFKGPSSEEPKPPCPYNICNPNQECYPGSWYPALEDNCCNGICCDPDYSCSSNPKQCGIWSAGCGLIKDCLGCPVGYSCSSSTSGICVEDGDPDPCVPDCQGNECGLDPVCGTLDCGNCVELHEIGWYCSGGTCFPPDADCDFTSAEWRESNAEITDTNEGTQITLFASVTSACEGLDIEFDIGEVDSFTLDCSSGCDYGDIDLIDTAKIVNDHFDKTISGTTVSVTWISEWILDENNGILGDDDPEYVFRVNIPSESKSRDSGTLEVTPGLNCGAINRCSDYKDQGNCTANTCDSDILNVSAQAQGITCGIQECATESVWYECNCGWNSTSSTCGFVFTQHLCGEGACGDGQIDPGEDCDGSKLPFTDCGGDPPRVDNCTAGTVFCNAPGTENECKMNYSQCVCEHPYGYCGDGIINSETSPGIYEVCDGNNLNGLTCADFDDMEDGTLACYPNTSANACQFDNSGCIGNYGGGFEVGTCSSWEDTINGCDDEPLGLYIASWKGVMDWAPSNGWANQNECVAETGADPITQCIQDPPASDPFPGLWYFDPAGLFATCTEGGETIIECPAKIKLGFFGFFNLITSLLIIAGIYAFLGFKKLK